jgi:DNA-directed RNA polymerase I subunit RPA2
MNIACTEDDLLQDQSKGKFSHIELSPMNMLSVVGSLTPFSDLNQSPRNMYQCQVNDLLVYFSFINCCTVLC